jgi:hypothetical protein
MNEKVAKSLRRLARDLAKKDGLELRAVYKVLKYMHKEGKIVIG